MAAHKKPRKSLEQEDLAAAVAEMIQSPITRANLSFLTTSLATELPSPAPAAKQTGRLSIVEKQTIEEPTIVGSSIPANALPTQDACGFVEARETTTPITTIVDTTTVRPAMAATSLVTSTVVAPESQAAPRTLPKVHQCRTVQDGHSPSEQGLYMMLWSIGTPLRDDIRVVQVSLSRLAPKSGMTIKNLQMMLRRLEEKKTISLAKQFSHATKSANAYHVYSYKAILQRRKEAGLEYVIRNKGVQFIPTEEALKILQAREEEDNRLFRSTTIEQTTIVDSVDNAKTTIEETSVSTIVKTTQTTIVDSAHIIEQGLLEQTTAAATMPAIVKLLRQELGYVDAAAVQRLIDECRRHAADATEAEIAYFVSQKLACARQAGNIRNPVGFLLTTVPACFEGESFRQFREEARRQRQNQEAERARLEAETARYHAVLEDPTASEQQKREARWYLGLSQELPW